MFLYVSFTRSDPSATLAPFYTPCKRDVALQTFVPKTLTQCPNIRQARPAHNHNRRSWKPNNRQLQAPLRED